MQDSEWERDERRETVKKRAVNMRKYLFRIKNGLNKIGDPLSWSTTDKCILWLFILPLPFSIGLGLLLILVMNYPESFAFYNTEIVKEVCAGFWVGAAFFGGLGVIGFLIRKRFPGSRVYVYTVLQVTWICSSVIIYLAGPLTSPAGATALFGTWLIAYTLFDRTPVLYGLGSFLVIQVLTLWACQKGLIPYAPLMHETHVIDGRFMVSWLIFIVGGCLLFIITNFVISGYIIERLRIRENRLDEMAKTDELTQLYNRRYFFDLFNKEMSRSLRYKRNMAMILGDIDHFKQINDVYGHLAGDEALVEVADALNSQLREHDIIARYGGEEFIILLPETDLEGANVVAERCRTAVESRRIHTRHGHTISLTISLGVTICLVTHGIKPEEMIKRADESLYRAKNMGRNRVVSTG